MPQYSRLMKSRLAPVTGCTEKCANIYARDMQKYYYGVVNSSTLGMIGLAGGGACKTHFVTSRLLRQLQVPLG